METRACSQIKTCRTCNNHLPYIREEDLPAGIWAPPMAASRSHWMFSLSLIRRLLNISHNYLITGIHEKNLTSLGISVSNTADEADGRHRHDSHVNFAKGKWNELAVLTFLGTQVQFYWFISGHTDMRAALLLFYFLSICFVSQR